MDDLSGFVHKFWFHLQKGQCESEPQQTNKQTNRKTTLYLVLTKASELADFPGVNTPLHFNGV